MSARAAPRARSAAPWSLRGVVAWVCALAVSASLEASSRQQATTPHAVDEAKLESLARDGTPEQRAQIEPAALAQAFREALELGEGDFAALGGRELDQALAAAIAAQPSSERGALLRCRGRVEQLVRLAQAGELPKHTRGRLELEDGGSVW